MLVGTLHVDPEDVSFLCRSHSTTKSLTYRPNSIFSLYDPVLRRPVELAEVKRTSRTRAATWSGNESTNLKMYGALSFLRQFFCLPNHVTQKVNS
jgi:hypothetical protein